MSHQTSQQHQHFTALGRCRMRISLGLKPLSMDNGKEKEEAAAREQHAKKQAEAKRAEQQRLAEKVKE